LFSLNLPYNFTPRLDFSFSAIKRLSSKQVWFNIAEKQYIKKEKRFYETAANAG